MLDPKAINICPNKLVLPNCLTRLYTVAVSTSNFHLDIFPKLMLDGLRMECEQIYLRSSEFRVKYGRTMDEILSSISIVPKSLTKGIF